MALGRLQERVMGFEPTTATLAIPAGTKPNLLTGHDLRDHDLARAGYMPEECGARNPQTHPTIAEAGNLSNHAFWPIVYVEMVRLVRFWRDHAVGESLSEVSKCQVPAALQSRSPDANRVIEAEPFTFVGNPTNVDRPFHRRIMSHLSPGTDQPDQSDQR